MKSLSHRHSFITFLCLGLRRPNNLVSTRQLFLTLCACQLSSALIKPIICADVPTNEEDTANGSPPEAGSQTNGDAYVDDSSKVGGGGDNSNEEGQSKVTADKQNAGKKSRGWDDNTSDKEILEDTPKYDPEKFEQRLTLAANDKLFHHIERVHSAGGKSSFGDLLDAGTGGHSLQWIASVLHRDKLSPSGSVDGDAEFCNADERDGCVRGTGITMNNYTAVTAAASMRRTTLRKAARFDVVDRGEILIGNWGDAQFLKGRKFDTILADYLVGAIDFFAPHFQDVIFERLVEHLKPGGRIYAVGLSPVEARDGRPDDVFGRIAKTRDACILLAGDRTYREYTDQWISRNMRQAGLEIVDSHRVPILQTRHRMVRLLDEARGTLDRFPAEGLAEQMEIVLGELEREVIEVTKDGPIEAGSDYVVSGELPLDWDEEEGQNEEGEPAEE